MYIDRVHTVYPKFGVDICWQTHTAKPAVAAAAAIGEL